MIIFKLLKSELSVFEIIMEIIVILRIINIRLTVNHFQLIYKDRIVADWSHIIIYTDGVVFALHFLLIRVKSRCTVRS